MTPWHSGSPRPGPSAIEVRAVERGAVVITLIGDHDLSTKQQLLAAIADVGERRDVVIDLAPCTFVDSTIVGALLAACQVGPEDDRRVWLVAPPDRSYVDRALSVLGLRSLLSLHHDRESALAARRELRRSTA
jgi:anti-anti-sigma factor